MDPKYRTITSSYKYEVYIADIRPEVRKILMQDVIRDMMHASAFNTGYEVLDGDHGYEIKFFHGVNQGPSCDDVMDQVHEKFMGVLERYREYQYFWSLTKD